MKLAVLLLSCLVGLSYQQSYGLWSSPMGHRAAFYHNIYADQFIHPSAVKSYESQDLPLVDVNDGLGGVISSVQGRVPDKFSPQQRVFFYGNLLPHRKTTTTTVTSTVTTVEIQSCIPKTYFALDAMNIPSTQGCGARKKRESIEEDAISPSEIEKMVASVEPKTTQKRHDHQPEILSSLDETRDSDFNAAVFNLRQKRIFDLGTYTVTTTTTTYTATTIKKDIFNRIEGKQMGKVDAGLACLPDGLVVC